MELTDLSTTTQCVHGIHRAKLMNSWQRFKARYAAPPPPVSVDDAPEIPLAHASYLSRLTFYASGRGQSQADISGWTRSCCVDSNGRLNRLICGNWTRRVKVGRGSALRVVSTDHPQLALLPTASWPTLTSARPMPGRTMRH